MAAAPSSELLFQHPRATSAALVFGGGDDTAPPVVAVTVNAAFVLGGVHVRATVSAPVRVLVAATLGGVTISAAVVYDNRVTRWLDQRAAAPHQVARSARPEWAGGWGITKRERGGTHLPWGRAHRQVTQPTLPLQPAVPLRQSRTSPWGLGTRVQQSASAVHQAALSLWLQKAAVWQTAQALDRSTASRMQSGIFYDHGHTTHWQPATAHAPTWRAPVGASLHLVGKQWAVMPWQTAGQPAPGLSVLPPTVVPFDPCYLPDGRLVFEAPWSADAGLVFVCERHGPGPEPSNPVIVPIQEVYLTINSAVLVRLDNGNYIPATSMSMSLDTDSWTWSFSASVPGWALPLVQHNSNGDPVVVQATINGADYRFAVESVGRDRTFNSSQLRVQGRGLAAELDERYAPTMGFSNANARTARQLLDDILTLNGVPIGWGIDAFDPTDWLVPAGVFNHTGSYISALNAVVGSVGAYLHPHNTERTFDVRLRYPTPAWAWGDITPQFVLPADITSQEGFDWANKPLYNRVFVSGQEGGMTGRYSRAGTAGDLLAPPVVDPLITHVDAARQRGRAILSDTGRIATVTLKLPVRTDTGIIKPGNFVHYTEGGNTHVGMTRGVSVNVDLPTIYQTLTVETHLEPV